MLADATYGSTADVMSTLEELRAYPLPPEARAYQINVLRDILLMQTYNGAMVILKGSLCMAHVWHFLDDFQTTPKPLLLLLVIPFVDGSSLLHIVKSLANGLASSDPEDRTNSDVWNATKRVLDAIREQRPHFTIPSEALQIFCGHQLMILPILPPISEVGHPSPLSLDDLSEILYNQAKSRNQPSRSGLCSEPFDWLRLRNLARGDVKTDPSCIDFLIRVAMKVPMLLPPELEPSFGSSRQGLVLAAIDLIRRHLSVLTAEDQDIVHKSFYMCGSPVLSDEIIWAWREGTKRPLPESGSLGWDLMLFNDDNFK
jgi:hypothetical protein